MKLTTYIRRHGWTLTEFAELSKVEISTLSRAATGKTIPSPRTMRRIMKASNGAVMPNDFFTPDLQETA